MRILLATDGSEQSTAATALLKCLVPAKGNEVTLLTVIPEHVFLGGLRLGDGRRRDAAARELRQAQESQAQQILDQAVGQLTPTGYKVEKRVGRGVPAEQVISCARNVRAEVVIIGARGATGSDRFPLGAVSNRVLKHAPCSVVLARQAPGKISRVVLATDGSRYSREAQRFLIDLPLPHRSQVFVVSVLQSHTLALLKTPTLDTESYIQIVNRLQQEEEESARDLLATTSHPFKQKDYDTTTMVRRGDPASEILALSESLNADLIVLGTRGHTGIESFVMGSVAQRVAKFARQSVLAVRPTSYR